MRHVRHVVAFVTEGAQQLYHRITQHEPLRFYRHGNRDNEHLLLGERHTKGEQDAIDGSRGTHRIPQVQVLAHGQYRSAAHVHTLVSAEALDQIIDVLGALLSQAGTQTAYNIICEETLRTHHLLNNPSEHPQREHVQ